LLQALQPELGSRRRKPFQRPLEEVTLDDLQSLTNLHLAAPEAGFVTGQTLFVCGGTSVGSIVY
jgi:hypothetical protein